MYASCISTSLVYMPRTDVVHCCVYAAYLSKKRKKALFPSHHSSVTRASKIAAQLLPL